MITELVTNGSLLLAFPIAFAAGAVAFLSPCVLPLAPGYVSYMTGLTGAELAAPDRPRRQVLVGSLLFVLGFSVVFVAYGAAFGGLGAALIQYADPISRVLGVLVIVLGLGYLGAFDRVAWFQREWRIHRAPTWGVAGAPLLGVLFGLGWTPCIGPTLAAVQSLAFSTSSAGRGALLSLAYCLGLGLPFVLLALLFSRAAWAIDWIRRHHRAVMRVGGALLIVVGLLLVTGVWTQFTIWLRVTVPGFETAL